MLTVETSVGLLLSGGTGLVVALLLMRGVNDWNDLSAGLDILLARVGIGTARAVVAAPAVTPNGAPEEHRR